MDPLIESLRTLIRQSTEAFGAEDPSTLHLEQQLAAVLASQQPAKKVFWLQSDGFKPDAADKKD